VATPARYSKTPAVRAWCATLDVGLAWIGLNDADSDRRRRVSQVAGRVGKARESAPGDGGIETFVKTQRGRIVRPRGCAERNESEIGPRISSRRIAAWPP
jgi:hypothetical protein